MFNNPAIEKYLMLQQIAQNQQQMPMGAPEAPLVENEQPSFQELPVSPLGRGSQAGLESAKRSLEMSNVENRRALGRAMMHFIGASSTHPPQEGSGFAGALGSLNAGFLPALNAYDVERNRIAEENFALMKHQEDLRRHQEAEEFARMKLLSDLDSEERAYNEMNAYQKAMVGMNREKTNKEEARLLRASNKRQELEAKGLIPEGAILFDEIEDPVLRRMKMEETQKAKNAFHPAIENLTALQEMKKIYKKYPTLWKDTSTILQLTNEENPTLIKRILSNVDPKKQAAAQTISKLINDINTNSVKQAAALGRSLSSDMMKRMIAKTMSEVGSAPEAFEAIEKRMSNKNLRVAKYAKMANEGWKHGISIPEYLGEEEDYLENYGKEPITDLETPPETSVASNASLKIRKPDGSIRELPANISEEDLQRLIAMGAEVIE